MKKLLSILFLFSFILITFSCGSEQTELKTSPDTGVTGTFMDNVHIYGEINKESDCYVSVKDVSTSENILLGSGISGLDVKINGVTVPFNSFKGKYILSNCYIAPGEVYTLTITGSATLSNGASGDINVTLSTMKPNTSPSITSNSPSNGPFFTDLTVNWEPGDASYCRLYFCPGEVNFEKKIKTIPATNNGSMTVPAHTWVYKSNETYLSVEVYTYNFTPLPGYNQTAYKKTATSFTEYIPDPYTIPSGFSVYAEMEATFSDYKSIPF
jgi:archaellum component FlaF (FlaF/FlaG flagellin family)